MRKFRGAAILFAVAAIATGAHGPATGNASNSDVEVSAAFMDAAAVQQAVGKDFTDNYTVIEVTVTPKGGKPIALQPDDFLLRIPSDADSTGPLMASQVLDPSGGLILHKGQREVVGINLTDPGNTGVTAGKSDQAPKAAIDALQSKMVPTKKTSDPVTGLLFFPIAKKKPGNLDLVYTTPSGKLHIRFR